MTRKDYERIARMVRDARPMSKPGNRNAGVDGAHAALDNFARFFADDAGAENPRFDRARFLAACGVAS